jgi:hypothetical protein
MAGRFRTGRPFSASETSTTGKLGWTPSSRSMCAGSGRRVLFPTPIAHLSRASKPPHFAHRAGLATQRSVMMPTSVILQFSRSLDTRCSRASSTACLSTSGSSGATCGVDAGTASAAGMTAAQHPVLCAPNVVLQARSTSENCKALLCGLEERVRVLIRVRSERSCQPVTAVTREFESSRVSRRVAIRNVDCSDRTLSARFKPRARRRSRPGRGSRGNGGGCGGSGRSPGLAVRP